MKRTRTRAPNFTHTEIVDLLRLVQNYPVIDSKKTDSATTEAKNEAWENLAKAYNSRPCSCQRTDHNLLGLYKNIKNKVKFMYSSQYNENINVTASILLAAFEKHGQDWERVAQAVQESPRPDDAFPKREINHTDSASLASSSNNIAKEKKKILEELGMEETDGDNDLDGDDVDDDDFIKEQKPSLPINLEILPVPVEQTFDSFQEDPLLDSDDTSRHTAEKGFRESPLDIRDDLSSKYLKKRKKKNVSESFQELAEDKRHLVAAQQTLIELQIECERARLERENIQKGHFLIQMETAKKNLKFQAKKNELELKYLRKKYEKEFGKL